MSISVSGDSGVLWRYTLSRNLMDVARIAFFPETHVVRDRYDLPSRCRSQSHFAVTHIRQLIAFIRELYMTGRQDIVK